MGYILWMGVATVAGGLGLVAAGVGRSMASKRGGPVAVGAIEAILDESDFDRRDLEQPFVVRLFGPASETLQRATRAVTPARWLGRMRRQAILAGLGRSGIEGVFALKAAAAVAGALVLPLLAAMVGATFGGIMLWAVLGAVLGFFVPDVWIARRANRRQGDIRRTLPETLDLMAISVQAGLGLESAIELVSRKLPGALGEELHRLLQEIQLGTSRRQALQHLRERTEVPELSTFALALVQADVMGSPIADVLRTHAAEMRMLRRQRAREMAAKVPVKLLFPLLVGIFPALGIVILGPAVISIAEAFKII